MSVDSLEMESDLRDRDRFAILARVRLRANTWLCPGLQQSSTRIDPFPRAVRLRRVTAKIAFKELVASRRLGVMIARESPEAIE